MHDVDVLGAHQAQCFVDTGRHARRRPVALTLDAAADPGRQHELRPPVRKIAADARLAQSAASQACLTKPLSTASRSSALRMRVVAWRRLPSGCVFKRACAGRSSM